MLQQLLVLAVLASHVSAVAFRAPRATSQAEIGDPAFPPKPTPAPPFPLNLFRRQVGSSYTYINLRAPDNTCGFFSGSSDDIFTCRTDYKCNIIPAPSTGAGWIGCCNTLSCGGVKIDCIASSAYKTGCDIACETDTDTLKCTDATRPYCNGITFPGENVRNFFCDQSYISTWQTASTTFKGESDGRRFSTLTFTTTSTATTTRTGGTTTKPSPSTSTSKSPPTTESTESPTTESTSPSPTTKTTTSPPPTQQSANSPSTTASTSSAVPSPTDSSSPAPIGGIVGGTVGGVAGIALIGLAAFFILRRKKQKNAAQSSVQPPTYLPPQDPNSSAYIAAGGVKPSPNISENPANGQWTPAPAQYQYPPQMQQQQQQQYTPMFAAQTVHDQQQRNLNPGYYAPTQDLKHQSQSSSPMPQSPNSQSHLSAAFPDRGVDSSPSIGNRVSELGTAATWGTPNSPTQMSAVSAGGTAAAAPRTGVEDRAEMSANMSGPPQTVWPEGSYEVAGSELQGHQRPQ